MGGILMKAKKLVFSAAFLLFFIIGIVPVVRMAFQSFIAEGHFSFENYALLFGTSRSWLLLGNSVILALASSVIVVLFGVPLGVLLTKTDLPLRNIFLILFMLPLIIPPYFLSLAWIYLLGGHARFLSGFGGSLLIMASSLMPLAILLTKVYLHTINPRLEETARLYAGWPFVLKEVSLPLIKRGIALAALLVFILTLGEFGVPTLFRFNVFSVESFSQFSAFYDFNAATAATTPLGIVALLVLALERWLFKKDSYDSPQLIPAKQMLVIPLKAYRPVLAIGVALILFILIVLPLGALFLTSFDIQVYSEVFSRAKDSLGRSILLASLASTLLTGLGFCLGYGIQRKVSRFSSLADGLTVFLFALPGTVIGIGLIGLWNRASTNFIYSSIVILLFGYVAQYTALASRLMVPVFSRIPVAMEEAAEIAGASWPYHVFRILIPLARKGLLATWLVLFIFCLKDVGVAMMVYPPGYDTLSIRIFTLMANSPEALIAAMCMMMFTVAVFPFLILAFFFRERFS